MRILVTGNLVTYMSKCKELSITGYQKVTHFTLYTFFIKYIMLVTSNSVTYMRNSKELQNITM